MAVTSTGRPKPSYDHRRLYGQPTGGPDGGAVGVVPTPGPVRHATMFDRGGGTDPPTGGCDPHWVASRRRVCDHAADDDFAGVPRGLRPAAADGRRDAQRNSGGAAWS